MQSIKIKNAIEAENLEQLASINKEEYASSKLSQFALKVPEMDFNEDNIKKTWKEKAVPFTKLHEGVEFDGSRSKLEVTFHIPYKGDFDLLQHNPDNQIYFRSIEIFSYNQHACFIAQSDAQDPKIQKEEIKTEKQRVIKIFQEKIPILAREIAIYNNQLPGNISQVFKAHKQKLLERKRMIDEL